jgi:hypothetical protein
VCLKAGFPLGDFSREQAKRECDWLVMSSTFVASQSSCFCITTMSIIFSTQGDVTKQADLSKFYRNLLDRNVSTGGSYDTEQHTETPEENTTRSRLSPSREKEPGDSKKTERRERTSEKERKRRDYRESEGETHCSSM